MPGSMDLNLHRLLLQALKGREATSFQETHSAHYAQKVCTCSRSLHVRQRPRPTTERRWDGILVIMAPMGRHISYYGADGTAPECDAWRAVGVDLDFEACILCDVRVPRHDDLRAAVVVHDQTD